MVEKDITAALIVDNHPTAMEKQALRDMKRRLGVALAGSVLLLTGCSQAEEDTSPQTVELELSYDLDPDIIQLPNPLPNPEGGRQITPKGITLHWWAINAHGNIQALRDELFSNTACGDMGCSVQYAVTEKGDIYRMMASATEYAYHAGTANSTTFGIEIEGGPEDFALPGEAGFNKKKFEATVSLTAELIDDFDLPIVGPAECGNVSGIHSHYEYNDCTDPPGHKIDVNPEYTRAVIKAVKTLQ